MKKKFGKKIGRIIRWKVYDKVSLKENWNGEFSDKVNWMIYQRVRNNIYNKIKIWKIMI